LATVAFTAQKERIISVMEAPWMALKIRDLLKAFADAKRRRLLITTKMATAAYSALFR